MAISGIGSYGGFGVFGYQSQLNDYRLQQALANNSKYNSSSSSSSSSTSSTSTTGSMDFLKKYSSTMSDLMQSANTLRDTNSSGVFNDLNATSSDTSVAEATKKYRLKNTEDIQLDVAQIATTQVNNSTGVKSAEKAVSSMDFNITDGSGNNVAVKVDMTNADGGTKTNRQMLQEAANQINKNSSSGVRATLVEKDGVSSLKLESKKTGAANGFSVSGDLGAAAGAENTSQAAQNAEYTVTQGGRKNTYVSASNDVSVDYARIGVKLKAAGSTTISAQVDSDKVASAVSDLLDSYNDARKVLNDNADRGSGVTRQLNSLLRGIGTEQGFEKLGIKTNKDGTLSLDKDTLKKSLAEEPDLVKDLISGSHGIAQNAYAKANSAMTANANSLLSNDLKAIDKENAQDSINLMNMFSKSGVYNMMNYNAVGLMMNYLV